MAQRKPWTEQQDNVLRTLKEERGIEKWTVIAELMKSQFNLEDRNSKQCRQRYWIKLVSDSNILKRQWTAEQDQVLFNLHNQFGNKWAIIADRLKGRTDNCIKNHFYSRLRKGLRKVNKIIEEEYKKTFKEFKIIDLYKVIEASDQKFKQVKSFSNELTDMGLDLKNKLFIFAEQESDDTEQQKQYVRKMIEDLTTFTKNYKRKSKKSRRYSPMGADSIYRVNAHIKKCQQQTESGQQQQKMQSAEKSQSKQHVYLEEKMLEEKPGSKILNIMKVQQGQKTEKKQEKVEKTPFLRVKEKKSAQSNDVNSFLKKEGILQQQQPKRSRRSKNKEYRHFSDDEEEEKNDEQFLRQQRLNNFAQNLLKTFKSYYSYQSFHSNSAIDDPFFQ